MTEPTPRLLAFATPGPPVPADDVEGASVLEPRKWDKRWKGPFLEALSASGNVTQSARHAGITTWTVYNERNHLDPVFREAWAEAEAVSVDILEALAVRRARGEPRRLVRTTTKRYPDGTVETTTVVEETTIISNSVLLRLLEARRPSVWGRRVDHRHGGEGGGPIQHEIGPRRRTRERLIALLELAEELGVGPPPPDDVDGTARLIEAPPAPSENGTQGE